MKLTKALTLLAFFACIITDAHAQLKESDYITQANIVRKSVWGWNIKAFDARTVPAEYAKYSKVVLAKHEEITGLEKSKVKFWGLGFQKQKDITYTHTLRELVKINDQAALDDYSEISFQKYGQINKDKLITFLGVRIIKPDGTMKEIDPDEVILTDNTDKNKKGKLAIPDLQIGDMLDFFIQSVASYDFTYGGELDYEDFVFADESPIMYYSVHIEASSKLAVEYRPMNGAPDFKTSQDADKENIMDAEENNITPSPTSLWMSPYRQIPILRLHMLLGFKGSGSHKAGEVYKNISAEEFVQYYDNNLTGFVVNDRIFEANAVSSIKKYAESYVANNGGGKIKQNSLSLYYALRHVSFYEPDADNVGIVNQQRNYFTPTAINFLATLQAICRHYDITAQFILLPSKYGPRADEVMSTSDYELALLTSDDHVYTVESIFAVPDEIPYYMEGQQGTTLDYTHGFNGYKSTKGSYSTGVSAASKNVHTEDLVYTFDPSQPQKITVKRKATLTGLMRLDEQKELGLYEDNYEEERTGMGIKESFEDELKDSKKGRKIVDEYRNAFADARKEWKDNFKDEIQSQFDEKPEEVISCKVDQCGLFDSKPAFIYSSEFTVNAWIKKAGNNFILDAGKMIGGQLKLKPEQRERKVDVYMPYARTLQYNVQMAVPQGYSVEGLDKLNTSFDNSSAAFVTTAKLDGSTIKITVTKTYKNAFVPAKEWPELVGMIDAADSFENARILFKKS